MTRPTAIALATILGATSAATAADTRVTYFPVAANSGPHDVAPAPDGSVYYTGQRKGVLGRLDPVTGKDENIPIGSGSAPHGVIVAPDGAAWITDGGLNANVRFDPKTRKFDYFMLPPNMPPANLNTGAFDRTASTGSPARTACTATSIPRPESTRAGSRRAGAPTASP